MNQLRFGGVSEVCPTNAKGNEMTNATKVNGKTIQIDRSGVGHSWRPLTSDDSHDTTPDIIEEIAAEIIDGGKKTCDLYVATNGLRYRW